MTEIKLTVQAPTLVNRDFVKPTLCGPGPCDVWPSVNEALTKPVISPICDEHFYVLDDIRAGLKYVFQTNCDTVLALSGSGHGGMETVINNLVGPGETLLVAKGGFWCERALEMAKRYGINTITTTVPMNETFSLQQLENELRKHRPTALFIVHGDSSTGTVQNLKSVGELCQRYGTLLLVDTVVSLVGVPFFMDDWKIDAVYTSTQKAFSGPAGISPVAFSDRALNKINNRTHQPPFYFDVKLLSQQWNCYGSTRVYHHTLSSPLLWALRQCLQEVIKETLPRSWARHAATTKHFLKRVEQLSLKTFVPKPEDRLMTVTTVVLPKGYDYLQFSKYMREKYNILIFPGIGQTVGKTLRIGLMGVNSTIQVADAVADAVAGTLIALKKSSL